ncbi:hypothetical protein E4U54_004898 [Claviceps lovelessii]|nr:hypothetical protein E4U54_004898 [Claviceps lovelessii]
MLTIPSAKGVYADPRSAQPPIPSDAQQQATESSSGPNGPNKAKPKNRVLVTIPPKVISKAVGLAIFTTLRAGFQISGATGSGVLIARLPDGSWGPPSGISVHSLGGGLQIGLEIYDCVCVINSREALSAFVNTRVSLGSDLAVAAGPYGAGGAVDFGTAVPRGRQRHDADKQPVRTEDEDAAASHQGQASAGGQQEAPRSDISPSRNPTPAGSNRRGGRSASAFKPVFSYVKSRGFYAGIQVDGTVIVQRHDANSTFYASPVTVQQILQGQVPPPHSQGPKNMWPAGARRLMETLKGAEAGPREAGSAATASSASTADAPANSTLQATVYPEGSHRDLLGSNSVGTQSGLAHRPFAGNTSSGAPPASV